MKLLVLGGTAWVGGAIVRAALAAGHEVTCVARGAAVPAGAALIRADRDTDDALAPACGTRWDAVIDVARQPGHVRRAVRDLDAARSVLVSSASVYASHAQLGADEGAARLPALAADRMASMEQYGEAKVACEGAVLAAFGPERSLIVRPGLIGGRGDPSGRTDYWAWRFAAPATPEGTVLVPDAPWQPTAVIDVRDLAGWIVRATESDLHGTFDAVGESVPFREHLALARAAAGHTGRIVAAPESWLLAHGVQEWAGPRSLPLWLPDPAWHGMGARSGARAVAAGLVRRPLDSTLADSLAWRLAHPDAVRAPAGLTDEEERALLAELGA